MILGKDITVGTQLLWLVENGQYYKETREVIRTVASIELTPEYEWADGLMTFEYEYPHRRQWFIKFDKEYKTADEFQNRFWLDGDPNNPL
jgi:hypothetical protein